MPQLFSQASTKHREEPEEAVTFIISSTPDRPSGPLLEETNKHDEEENDAVTSKTPKD